MGVYSGRQKEPERRSGAFRYDGNPAYAQVNLVNAILHLLLYVFIADARLAVKIRSHIFPLNSRFTLIYASTAQFTTLWAVLICHKRI
jgi:hypothetical protein